MAEVAPLTAAHTHARRAAEETAQVHWEQAAAEHQGAALDFARAARATSDIEALRILKLLEEQHQRVARIIKSQDAAGDTVDAVAEPVKAEHPEPVADDAAPPSPVTATPKPPAAKAAAARARTASALSSTRPGSQARDSSPSLAREIASRRGIPPPGRAQPSAAAQARARQLSPESHRRWAAAPTSKVPPPVVDSRAGSAPARNAKTVDEDESFARFYSTLTTGAMSKLSSMLAYAGAPLTADDVKPGATAAIPPGSTVKAGNEPNMKKYFSKATLRAIEDDHRRRGTAAGGFGPAESFYVVPHSGMTKSYAQVTGKPRTPLPGGLDEADEDAFVDAREVPAPPSPTQARGRPPTATGARDAFGKERTHEELELENSTLKQTLEQLLGRLEQFEVHAQDATMAALTQSMATLRPGGGPDASMAERVRQLEQQVEKEAEQRQKLEAHAMRQEKQLKKWHSNYEKLKVSAREKMKAKEKSDKPPTDEAAASDTAPTG